MAYRKNIGPIPVPEWAKVTSTGRVFFKHKQADGVWKTIYIGQLANSAVHSVPMMLPNDAMLKYHGELVSDYVGEAVHIANDYIVGPYAVTLRLAATSGLYQAVQRGFGQNVGNALMDYALMCNVLHSNAAYNVDPFVESYVHFSQDALSSSSMSETLRNTSERDIVKFRIEWLKTYKERFENGEIWLSIDGSNHDCKAVGSAIAEHGMSKSGNSCNVIGQIWAIDTVNKIPVTWFVNDGNVHDCKAVKEVIVLLESVGLKVRGVILDRAFATEEIMSLITTSGYEYVIMLKAGCSGYEEMLSNHADEIRHNLLRRVAKGGIYGIMDKVKVFKKSDEATNVGLFFNHINSAERAEYFADKVFDELERLRNSIKKGNYSVTPASQFANILSIERFEDGQPPVININYVQWQVLFDAKGYFALACSEGIDIDELLQIYDLRDTSEKVFSELKSQLGFDTLRGHSDSAILARVACSFIAAVNRQMLIVHCKKIDQPVNIMMQKLNRVTLIDHGDGFFPSFTAGKQVKSLFDSVGLTTTDFNDLAIQLTTMHGGERLPECRTLHSLAKDKILTLDEERHLAHVNRQKDAEKAAKKAHIGRPKGSKNKKTLERERLAAEKAAAEKAAAEQSASSATSTTTVSVSSSASPDDLAASAKTAGTGPNAQTSTTATSVVKRSLGRPKGSKNKKTLAREALEAEQAAAEALKASQVKRGPGRPKGSLNKKTIAFNEMIAAEKAKEKRGRGRPKGSKNKKTLAKEATLMK